ncbi:hypothetical protein [Streptomyces sp. NBC_01465]|uniref:hypothetical protein n=1 Tax=Streptomyces sp. NBC_01465 TaxID=2903878 RepID=UPI002E3382C7|nr:hypothetical protein [Streptomyces sp. NBC_01465]
MHARGRGQDPDTGRAGAPAPRRATPGAARAARLALTGNLSPEAAAALQLTAGNAALAATASAAPVQRAKSALFAAKPEAHRTRSDEDDPDREYRIADVALADTHSAQGEHVFNAVNALALELAGVLDTHLEANRTPGMSPELAAGVAQAVGALRDQARALGVSRDNHQYRAAPAGQGNPANATSYSEYAQQVRRAVAQATGGANPVLGWSTLVDLSRQVRDRAVDQTARAAQQRALGAGFTTWFDTTNAQLESTFTALLTAVSTVRTAIASSRSTPGQHG